MCVCVGGGTFEFTDFAKHHTMKSKRNLAWMIIFLEREQ